MCCIVNWDNAGPHFDLTGVKGGSSDSGVVTFVVAGGGEAEGLLAGEGDAEWGTVDKDKGVVGESGVDGEEWEEGGGDNEEEGGEGVGPRPGVGVGSGETDGEGGTGEEPDMDR